MPYHLNSFNWALSCTMSSFLLISYRKQVGPALSNFSKKEDCEAWGLRSNSPGGEPWQGFRESVLSEGEWGEQDGHRAEQGYGLRWGPASSRPHGEPSNTNNIPELGPVMAASKRGWGGSSFPDKGGPDWLGAILWKNQQHTQWLGNRFQPSKEDWTGHKQYPLLHAWGISKQRRTDALTKMNFQKESVFVHQVTNTPVFR